MDELDQSDGHTGSRAFLLLCNCVIPAQGGNKAGALWEHLALPLGNAENPCPPRGRRTVARAVVTVSGLVIAVRTYKLEP